MSLKTTFITLDDGTEICAPEQVKLMTHFVLEEQGGWFEDEINFVRAFIKPGMQVLDIGANYGLYSTVIASKLKPDGRLWCFEPTQDTADALRKTIKQNHFEDTIELIQAGLSDHQGQATFYTSPNAELNSLTETESTTGEKQTIDLLTLDYCCEKYQWQHLDFIKLDAEGEELNILKEAKHTLARCSPLVMFELKHGSVVNIPLITAFKNLGYESYQLIPGLNILAPFDLEAPIDGYLLNLFCCKEDTAKKLANDGYLVNKIEQKSAPEGFSTQEFFAQFKYTQNSDAKKPIDNDSQRDYQSAVAAYVCSRDTKLSSDQRFAHLLYALGIVKKRLAAGESNIERLSTYARIAFDIGRRSTGVKIIDYLLQKYVHQKTPFQISHDFLPPGPEFEIVDPNGRLEDWLCAAIIDQFIRKYSYSCYFSVPKSWPYFAELKRYGFMQAAMAKREATIKKLAKS